MLQRNHDAWQRPGWQQALAGAINDPMELLALLELPADLLPAAKRAAESFPLRVPRGYVARMRKGNVHDPLLRQVLPLADEWQEVSGYSADPVGDLKAMPVPGVLHKYYGRALLITTGACAIHCRYCFRRHFPYAEAHAASAAWQPALDHIAADESISEVILSGGDPLVLSNQRLSQLTQRLVAIPHLKRLRLHTRLPITLPERIDEGLLSWLRGLSLPMVVVIHANHAQEIDGTVARALDALRSSGILLLNQAVLLRGVNDDPDSLVNLSEILFKYGVLPYYIHVLDKVMGAAHFDVDRLTARTLMGELRTRLPGYLVPRLVSELAGAAAKLPAETIAMT